MKVYICESTWSARGAYEDIYCIVVAECESVALGLCLEKYPQTTLKDWSIEDEIKTDERIITEIYINSN